MNRAAMMGRGDWGSRSLESHFEGIEYLLQTAVSH